MPEGKIARLKQGWLVKQGGRVKNWKKRFFVLDGSCRLAYYLSEADAQAGVGQLGIINLTKALYVTPRAASLKDTTIFWPSHVPTDVCFTIITQERNYGIYSDVGAEDCRRWLAALQKVRGNVDTSTLDVDDMSSAGSSGFRPRANTLAMLQDPEQISLTKQYKMAEIPPKVLAVFCKWHRLLENTLKALAEQFDTKPYTFECDMGELFAKAPKLRTRLGELVFGDYVDELRYNVSKAMGDEEIGREAFVEATGKRTIRFAFVDKLPGSSPTHVSVADGILLIEVDARHLGKGVHLTGNDLIHSFKALSSEPVCGGSVKGLPLADALNVCRSKDALDQALTRLGRALSTEKFTFECDYLALHEAAAKAKHAELQQRLGNTIVGNIVTELCTLLAGQAYSGKNTGLPANLATLLSAKKILFKLTEEELVTTKVNEEGVLVVSTGVEKLSELAVYERAATLDLKAFLEQAENVGTSM